METFSAGWRRVPVDGGLLLIAPDPTRGVVRVRTDVPLRPVKQIVSELADSPGGKFQPKALPRAFATAEGEHAALFELGLDAGALKMRRTVVVIVGDASMVVLDGRVIHPDAPSLAAGLEEMATSFSLGLGSDRWRRFHYAPPAGWHRLARYHADLWLPPNLPANSAELTVSHARPMDPQSPVGQHVRLFEQISSEFRGTPLERHALKLPSGLEGEFVTHEGIVEGEVRRATVVSLSHARRQYLFRLDTGSEHGAANLDVLRAVVMSAQPLPGPKQPAAAAELSPWSE